ncbi:MAG: acyl-CoA dehydrogenase family protein, partial [Candidatus Binatia bacterium]|nr:acyl-CoA dehydrogenase family protein [Candidatus Binatia bacterium]
MDFGLTEEQEMLRRTARDFLGKECPKTVVRAMEKDEKGYSPEMLRKPAELGWTGLVFPEEYGGSEGSFLDLAIILEEMGRALLPGPFISTVVLGGLPILYAGSDEQKKTFLPRVAEGDLNITLALTEPNARYDAAGVEVKASREGDGYILSGTKLFVPGAHTADYLLWAARTRESQSEEGITLFLVDTEDPGLSCVPLPTISSDKLCEVTLQNVKVPLTDILGEVGRGWDVINWVLERAATAESIWMVGGAQQVLEMTTTYAKERIQFDRPIGSFQAIQHKCADMVVEIDGARCIAYLAAWKLSEGLSASLEVSMAKAWVSEAYRNVCFQAHQIHGGIG